MKSGRNIDQFEEDLEARQRNVLWEDSQDNARRLSASLWKDDAKIRPDSIPFAFLFLVLGIGLFALPFVKGFGAGRGAALVVALGPLWLAYKLFRQGRLRKSSSAQDEEER